MQKTLDSLIHESQTGFIKGRNIAQNIMQLQTMLDYCEKNKKSAIVVSFDFKKACDSVEWESIYQSMKFLGFTEQSIHWVKTLYVRPLSCIMNNGYWGDFFELQKSTRQGDPASYSL